MSQVSTKLTAERMRSFFLLVLFFSIPFSIAGDDFAIIGLYLCTIYLFIKKKEQWISTRIQYGIAVLILGAIIAALVSSEPLIGLKYFRAFWRFGLPFLVFLGLRHRPLDTFLKVIIIVSSLMAVYASVQFFTGIDVFRSISLQKEYVSNGKTWHAVGAFSHHLTYGGVSLVLFGLFTPPVFDKGLPTKKRLLFAIGSVCNLAAIIFSLGRSIWTGALVALIVMIFLKLRFKAIVVILLLFSIGYGIYSQVDPGTKKAFYTKTTIGRRLNSFNTRANVDRIMMWTAAINIIKDNPVFGVGPKNSDRMQPYYDELAKSQKYKFQHKASVGVHNIYLQTWIDFGLLGLIGYLSWWLILLSEILFILKKTPVIADGTDTLLSGLFAGFIGIMIAGVFENNFRDGEVQTAIFTAMGIALTLIYKKRKAHSSSSHHLTE